MTLTFSKCDLKKRKANISLERLSLPMQNYGGMGLRRIEDVFSAAKTKVLMRALLDKNDLKYSTLLIFLKAEKYAAMGAKEDLIHPFCWFQQNTNRIGKDWPWFKQASKLFNQIDKDCTYFPEIGDSVFDAVKETVTYIEDSNDLFVYKPVNSTFPALISNRTKRRLKEKKEEYLKRRKINAVTRIVTIGHRNASETPTKKKTHIYKGRTIDWIQKLKVEFNQLSDIKYKKINLKLIFKITIDQNIKYLWTEKQEDWIVDHKIDVAGLLSNNIKTISRIDDFRRKFLMGYWGRLCEKCELCGEKWKREHLFLECEEVKKWEREVFNNNDSSLACKERRKSLFDRKNPNHTFSWIYNWTIWKNYWEIVHKSFENCLDFSEQVKNFEKLVKFNEYLHLRFSIATQTQKNLKKVLTETEFFHFFSLNHAHFGLEKKKQVVKRSNRGLRKKPTKNKNKK